MIIGYARVSTLDQNIKAQIAALKAAGAEKVYYEKASGKDKERPELEKLLSEIRAGDTVIINSFSRLARNTKHLLEITEGLESKGAALKSLKESLDTRGAAGKLMLTILGALATFERELMLEKQREGIEYAKKQGKYKGTERRYHLTKKEIEIFDRVEAGHLTNKEAIKLAGVGYTTYYKLKKEYRESVKV